MVSMIKIKRRILDFIHNVVSKYSVPLFFPVWSVEAADWRSVNHRVCGGRLCFPWGSAWRVAQMRSETGGVEERELSEVLKCRGSERS